MGGGRLDRVDLRGTRTSTVRHPLISANPTSRTEKLKREAVMVTRTIYNLKGGLGGVLGKTSYRTCIAIH